MEKVVAPHDTDPASTTGAKKSVYNIFFLLTIPLLLSFLDTPRWVVVSPEILHTFLSSRMLGAGRGIRTHAAHNGDILSSPAHLDPHFADHPFVLRHANAESVVQPRTAAS